MPLIPLRGTYLQWSKVNTVASGNHVYCSVLAVTETERSLTLVSRKCYVV